VSGTTAPLAARVRPNYLADVIGHVEVLAPIRRLLAAGTLPSLLLYGPPGVGKTTVARAAATEQDAVWVELSAVDAGVKQVRAALAGAVARRAERDAATVLFLDEVHRFNKAQQDALLPAVEDGTITLLAATTENPFFTVTSPLLSRCRLVALEPLTGGDVAALVARALDHPDGLAGRFTLAADVAELLSSVADGDGRTALNLLDAAAAAADGDGETVLRRDHLDDVTRRLRYDRDGDDHYDQVSAFIKSVRGSDPDAAVYWLTRMLAAGEDPRFVARRLVILASEDIGLADRSALPTAVAAFHAAEFVGMPEARHALTHTAVLLAVAPKSASVTGAMAAADRLVSRHGSLPVPTHLRDSHYRAAKALGHGTGYRYPHDDPSGFVSQQYLPDTLDGTVVYQPTIHGQEGPVGPRLADLWPARRR